jgi:hypothetical protein
LDQIEKIKALDQVDTNNLNYIVDGPMTPEKIYKIKEEFKLEWNEKFGQYEKSMLLKQAYYNYHYVTVNEDQSVNLQQTEGDFSATENDYHVMIYHKNQFMQYDELLGTAYINSNRR